MDKWRLIRDGRRSAAFNMAADDFLLEQAESAGTVPVLRLYGWDKPSITIGYHQKLERAVDVTRLGHTPVVRRSTGGRALLHDDGELTYAVAGDFIRHPILGATLRHSYNMIADAIVRFYRAAGWPAVIAHRDRPIGLSGSKAVQKGCFAAVSLYEIVLGGQKVAAGSQRRTRCALLQHGAIKIAAPTRHAAVLDAAQSVELGFPPLAGEREQLEERLATAVAEVFQVHLVIHPFTWDETEAIIDRARRFDNLAGL